MFIDIRLYKRFDMDILSLLDAGYNVKKMMEVAIIAFSNGRAATFVIDKITKFKLDEKQTVHFRANIPDSDTKSVALMRAIKPGYRNAFCKALLRNSFAQQNLVGYFDEDWCNSLLSANYYNKGINFIQNPISLDDFHRETFTRTIDGETITHKFKETFGDIISPTNKNEMPFLQPQEYPQYEKKKTNSTKKKKTEHLKEEKEEENYKKEETRSKPLQQEPISIKNETNEEFKIPTPPATPINETTKEPELNKETSPQQNSSPQTNNADIRAFLKAFNEM